MKKLACCGLLFLSACNYTKAKDDYKQTLIDSAHIACRDNVEYLVFASSYGYITATPHLKPSGQPFTCKDK